MIVSKIFDIKINENLTQKTVQDFLQENGLNTVKWYVTSVSEKIAKIFVAFEKKAL